MKRCFIVFLILICSQLWSQSAKSVIAEACKKDSVEQSISYMEKNIVTMQDLSEKRGAYIYLAGIQEKMGRFSDAQKNYAAAAAIAAGDADGMAKRSSEQLVLDAVRCALCGGEGDIAQNYLNSAVRSSKNGEVAAYVKLYDQWALLVKAENLKDTEEVVAMLKTYAELDSMKCVHPQILLTLWHITGQENYADRLKKSFAGTPEELIVSGKVNLKPSPFWYFVPRKGGAVPEVVPQKTENVVTAAVEEEKSSGSSAKGSEGKKEKITRQQLGLFKDKANAEGLIEKLKKKGFNGKITSEVRPSGTTYYIVVVDENKTNTIGQELRTAGFDCYPVFE